jgi:hypothetical protein
MFHVVKSKNPAPFGTGVKLAEKQHEQKQNALRLLAAEFQLER